MSIRGEVVLECEMPNCHAEQVYDAARFYGSTLWERAHDDGWTIVGNKWRCPQCSEEAKDHA